MITKAMIMAAGVGTRLDPLTQTVPKPMIPVTNRPILELILKHLKKHGITDVVANTHYLADCIHEKFSNNNLGVNFNYIYEQELSGTAGGVKKCEWFFNPGETFVVISGDALTDVNIHKLVEKHKSSGAIATMALKKIPLSHVSHFGVVVVDENSKIIGFQEKPSTEEAKSNLVNTGIYVFNTDIFKYIPKDTFYDFAKNVFPAMMQNNEPLYAHVIEEYWSDIGTIEQYKTSSYDVFTSKVSIDPPYNQSEIGWVADTAKVSPAAIFNGKVVIGVNSFIEDNVEFFGNSIVGDNCIIRAGAIIKDAIIWNDVLIEQGAKLDSCIIASNTTIAQGSSIKPGCVIPEGCFIAENEKLKKDIKLQAGEEYVSVK
ncbi:MAG: NDP-sugar synthase [Ignavibacteriales bacterium]|nr:NDP-sugar synthase [Ignavibacteriales bacterium]